MWKRLKFSIILATALIPVASASAQSTHSQDRQALYEDEATKSCTDDLNHDRLDNYGSLDECVSDRAKRLAQKDASKSASAGTATPAH